jgi:Malonyl-CoA decarboxylase C-terminal domain
MAFLGWALKCSERFSIRSAISRTTTSVDWQLSRWNLSRSWRTEVGCCLDSLAVQRGFLALKTGKRAKQEKLGRQKRKRQSYRLEHAAEWEEIKSATRKMSKAEKKAYHLVRKAARKLVPLDFSTRLRKLFNTATRGSDQESSLADFVTLYPKLNRTDKATVIDFLSHRFRQQAFRTFFPRILQATETQGFLWMLQFRGHVMEYASSLKRHPHPSSPQSQPQPLTVLRRIRRRAKQQLERLELLANHIRYRMTEHFVHLSGSDDTTSTAVNTTTCRTIHPLLQCRLLHYPQLPPTVLRSLRYATMAELPFFPPRLNLAPLFDPTKRVHGWYIPQQPDLVSSFSATGQCAAPETKAPVEGRDAQAVEHRHEGLGVVIFVSFQPTVPSSMQDIYKSKPSREPLPVATVYGIVHLYSKLRALGIGELVTYQTLRQLQQQNTPPSSGALSVFVTLSPIYDLKQWLFREANVSTVSSMILNASQWKHTQELASIWDCPLDQVYPKLKALLTRNYEGYKSIVRRDARLEAAVHQVLLRAAAYYIVEAKTPLGKPLDNVARFHIHNGASVHRINLMADVSDEGWRQSCGIMINYRYDWNRVARRRRDASDPWKRFPVGENVIEWLTPPPPLPPPRKNPRTALLRKRNVPVTLAGRRRLPPLGSLRQHTWRREDSKKTPTKTG